MHAWMLPAVACERLAGGESLVGSCQQKSVAPGVDRGISTYASLDVHPLHS